MEPRMGVEMPGIGEVENMMHGAGALGILVEVVLGLVGAEPRREVPAAAPSCLGHDLRATFASGSPFKKTGKSLSVSCHSLPMAPTFALTGYTKPMRSVE